MSGRSSDISNAYSAVAVTPSDSTILPTARALYVGGTGDVVVRMASGVQATFTAVPAGVLPIQFDKVMAATAATGLLALY